MTDRVFMAFIRMPGWSPAGRRIIIMTHLILLPSIFLVAMSGRPSVALYDGQHPSKQLGREVVIRGTFDGPGVQADYVKTAGEPVYLEGDFFKTTARPAYGSQVEVRGVLKFKTFPPGNYQHPPDYYYIDRGVLKVLRP